MCAALLIYLIALAVAAGHLLHLIAAVPVFLVGSLLRIRAEDGVLEGEFGGEFSNYRRSTPALIPWTLMNRRRVQVHKTRDE
jgi:protein-S-isoprenylcysteine O-methyltransferase Ste14